MRTPLRILLRILMAPFRFVLWVLRAIAGWFSNLKNELSVFFVEEPEDTPLPEALAKTVQNPQGLLVHLDALRKHLLRSVIFLGITTALSFTFARQILVILAHPLPGGVEALRAIDPTEPIGTLMKISLLSGFALALPYIALELWLFIAPGIGRRSRIYGLLAIPIVALFFIGGLAFAYYVMLPTAIPFLLNVLDIRVEPRPATYIGFVTGLMFWIGILFEFPLVIFVLAGIGLVKAKTLAAQWRLAVVIIAIVAAMITPTIDPVSMSLVMAPMIALYFLSIGLAQLAQRGRA